MQIKVQRVTKMLFEEGGGNLEKTAKLFANFTAQPAIQPFVKSTHEPTPQQRFGENAIATLKAIRKVNRKPGSASDILRRHIIVSGSEGPLAPHKVYYFC